MIDEILEINSENVHCLVLNENYLQMSCFVGSDPLHVAVIQAVIFPDDMMKGAVTPDNS